PGWPPGGFPGGTGGPGVASEFAAVGAPPRASEIVLLSPASICAYTTLGFDRATSIAMRPYVPGGNPLPVSFVHVRPASSVFHNALPGPPPLKQHPSRRR